LRKKNLFRFLHKFHHLNGEKTAVYRL